MHVQFIPFSFFLAVLPTLIALIYPFLRLFGAICPTHRYIDFSRDRVLLITNVVLTFFVCSYTIRKAYVADVCGAYLIRKVRSLSPDLVLDKRTVDVRDQHSASGSGGGRRGPEAVRAPLL